MEKATGHSQHDLSIIDSYGKMVVGGIETVTALAIVDQHNIDVARIENKLLQAEKFIELINALQLLVDSYKPKPIRKRIT